MTSPRDNTAVFWCLFGAEDVVRPLAADPPALVETLLGVDPGELQTRTLLHVGRPLVVLTRPQHDGYRAAAGHLVEAGTATPALLDLLQANPGRPWDPAAGPVHIRPAAEVAAVDRQVKWVDREDLLEALHASCLPAPSREDEDDVLQAFLELVLGYGLAAKRDSCAVSWVDSVGVDEGAAGTPAQERDEGGALS